MTPMLMDDHLLALSDRYGVFEHCLGAVPRREHGFCVDDVSRALILLTRERNSGAAVSVEAGRLASRSLSFVLEAQDEDGLFVNRRAVDGTWYGRASAEDHWGRGMWSLGEVVQSADERRDKALDAFELGARHRPPFLRSMVFAGLGAAGVVAAEPDNEAGRSLLRDAADRIPAGMSAGWPWHDVRLTYANAAIPEVLIRGGLLLEDPRMLKRGLSLLDWLLDVEIIGNHLSVTPAGGWSQGELRPGFDQQPIEVAALVDACSAAVEASGDGSWLRGITMGNAWFEGDNDAGVEMGNPLTGAGYDGLHADGRNDNQGAESTLAYLMVVQSARLHAAVPSEQERS
ncbi:unannotated protein [freshwater metagenome]|uniref:Unannotated protein n=1 Tax=freshwater metagenome TaxID=449393 RepID=A0A6J7F2K1_9ZZZZ